MRTDWFRNQLIVIEMVWKICKRQRGELQRQSPKVRNSVKLFLPMTHSSVEQQQFPPNASNYLHLFMAHNWSAGRGMHLAFTSQWWTWSRHFGKLLGATCHRQKHVVFVVRWGLKSRVGTIALMGCIRRLCVENSSEISLAGESFSFWILLGGRCSKSLGHKWTYRYLKARILLMEEILHHLACMKPCK